VGNQTDAPDPPVEVWVDPPNGISFSRGRINSLEQNLNGGKDRLKVTSKHPSCGDETGGKVSLESDRKSDRRTAKVDRKDARKDTRKDTRKDGQIGARKVDRKADLGADRKVDPGADPEVGLKADRKDAQTAKRLNRPEKPDHGGAPLSLRSGRIKDLLLYP
jgi:hypothetical protein